MTKAEIVDAIKQAWTKELLDEKDIREDIADTYADWVRGLIQAAAPDLQGQPAASNGGQEQPGEGGMEADAQGGMPMEAQGGMM